MKKYELTNDTINHHGRTLYRIKALRDIPRHNVKADDLGGYIEKEDNLSHKNDCWVDDNAKVCGDAKVYGSARVFGKALVFGKARVWGDAKVYNNAWVFGDAWVFGIAEVFGKARVWGDAKVYDNAWVFGNAKVYENAEVSGDTKVYGDAWVFGKAKVWGDAKVYDNAWVSGNARVYGIAEVFGKAWVSDNTEVTDNTHLDSGLHTGEETEQDDNNKHTKSEDTPTSLTHGIVKNTNEGWLNLPDDKAYPILLTKTDGSNPVVVKERYMLQWLYECGHKEPINEGDKWYSLEHANKTYNG